MKIIFHKPRLAKNPFYTYFRYEGIYNTVKPNTCKIDLNNKDHENPGMFNFHATLTESNRDVLLTVLRICLKCYTSYFPNSTQEDISKVNDLISEVSKNDTLVFNMNDNDRIKADMYLKELSVFKAMYYKFHFCSRGIAQIAFIISQSLGYFIRNINASLFGVTIKKPLTENTVKSLHVNDFLLSDRVLEKIKLNIEYHKNDLEDIREANHLIDLYNRMTGGMSQYNYNDLADIFDSYHNFIVGTHMVKQIKQGNIPDGSMVALCEFYRLGEYCLETTNNKFNIIKIESEVVPYIMILNSENIAY